MHILVAHLETGLLSACLVKECVFKNLFLRNPPAHHFQDKITLFRLHTAAVNCFTSNYSFKNKLHK